MNKEGDPPFINRDILLLDPQETHICIIRQVGYRYGCHQPGKKGQAQEERCIDDIGAADNLSYF